MVQTQRNIKSLNFTFNFGWNSRLNAQNKVEQKFYKCIYESFGCKWMGPASQFLQLRFSQLPSISTLNISDVKV